MIIAALSTAAAVLLAAAGAAKLRTPGPAATMLMTSWPGLRPPRRARHVARAAGAVELGTALAVLAGGGRPALALLAACYLVLLVVALRLATGPTRAPCGCFGAADGDVGTAHVLLDLAGLGIAVWALVNVPAGLPDLFADTALTGVTLLAQAVLLAALGYLSVTALPALSAARRTVESAS